MSRRHTRRRYLRVIGLAGIGTISGCAGGQSNNTTTTTATTTTSTTTTTTTETTTETETTTTEPEPDFDLSIDAPDTVTNTESWSFAVIIDNNGGRGQFSSTISYRRNDGEWQDWDSVDRDVLAGAEGQIYKSDEISLPAPMEFHIRIDEPGVETTVQVKWAEKYRPANIRSNAQSPSYDDLFRDFESYEGKQIHFEYGYVYQTLFDQGQQPPHWDYYQIEVANNEEEFEGDIAANWYGDERLIEDDLIELWGVAEQLYSYETVQGDTRTIPLITLVDYNLRDGQ